MLPIEVGFHDKISQIEFCDSIFVLLLFVLKNENIGSAKITICSTSD